ncbi:hypothetical protein FJY90_02740 [Candidatus Gottesmanbacteria bacterium]|nr:hypothetical protein [Candidatus Gottesmanbacteria bacterium]
MANIKTTPYFLWDYDLSKKDIRRIIHGGSETDKRWLISRILEHAHFNDVFEYLTIKDIVAFFPRLKMRPTIKKYWQRALSSWGLYV